MFHNHSAKFYKKILVGTNKVKGATKHVDNALKYYFIFGKSQEEHNKLDSHLNFFLKVPLFIKFQCSKLDAN